MNEETSLDLFDSKKVISSDHLINVCKYRQGEQCCRYIYFPRGGDEFYCIKNIPVMKKKIDSNLDSMFSKGDNCLGLP